VNRVAITKDGNVINGYSANQGTYTELSFPNSLEPTNFSSSNYDITYARGSYTVSNNAELAVRVAATSAYAGLIQYQITGWAYCAGGACAQGSSTDGFFTETSGIYTFSNQRSGVTTRDSASFSFAIASDATKSTSLKYTAGSHSVALGNATVPAPVNITKVLITGNLTVTPLVLTVNAAGATKTYDGSLISSASVTASGIVSNDVVSVTGTTTFNSRNVGSNVPYTISNITLGGTDAGNYRILGGSTQSYSTGVITQRPITITATGLTREYSGGNTFTSTNAERLAITGVQPGDSLTSFNIGFVDKNVGTQGITFSSAVISDGNSGLNYAVT
jgi:hypothetical protein